MLFSLKGLSLFLLHFLWSLEIMGLFGEQNAANRVMVHFWRVCRHSSWFDRRRRLWPVRSSAYGPFVLALAGLATFGAGVVTLIAGLLLAALRR